MNDERELTYFSSCSYDLPCQVGNRCGPLNLVAGGPHNITSTLFEGNKNSVGGGLCVTNGVWWPVHISDSTFRSNIATVEGGGIWIDRGRGSTAAWEKQMRW